ncbi:unnamed protein product [Chrysoparadoxa australica]
MATFLPAPRHTYEVHPEPGLAAAPAEAPKTGPAVPPYLNRGNFTPRMPQDYGDGGAFPEIHVAQYPLQMGNPNASSSVSSSIVALDVDETGTVKHDAIVKQGSNKGTLVQTSLNTLKEKEGDKEKLALPSNEEEQATAERTRMALEKIVGSKMASSTPVGKLQVVKPEPKFVRYTPNPDAPGYNANAKQRVVRMVEAQLDPLQPPKHKHKKVPRGPPDDPVPVLHSPPRKVTAEDQQAWKIPPCISNWKNTRGFTIPLDKRLAADGRGLQETTVSHNFATLSESLYIAERKAREETRLRGEMQKHMALQEKGVKEKELRELAAKARMERAGIAVGSRDGGDAGGAVDEDERVAADQRERLRGERKKDRERELRQENMKGNFKKARVDRERDVSEKIALGQLRGSGAGKSGDGLYDSRLFNQSAGMDSGFGGEDEYNVYSKAMEGQSRGDEGIYRPKKDDGDAFGDADAQMEELRKGGKFTGKGFAGAGEGRAGGPRAAPVEFEKNKDGEADPFGLDAFLSEAKAKQGKKKS